MGENKATFAKDKLSKLCNMFATETTLCLTTDADSSNIHNIWLGGVDRISPHLYISQTLKTNAHRAEREMANTKQKNIGYAGLYERTRDYLKEKTALFGLLRWEEVVHTTQLDDDLILKIDTMKIPTVVYINGEEYKLVNTNLTS